MIDLSLLMPEFADKLKEFVIEAQYQGLDVDVESGYRSSQVQDGLYAQGRTTPGQIVTNAKGGKSWHNWSVAADVVFRKNGTWDWKATEDQYRQLAQIAKDHGLEWGGDFKSIVDLDHFQLTAGLTIQEAQQLGTVQKVQDEIRKRLT